MRIGPNQDINDPATLIQLLYEYQQKSKLVGDLWAQYTQRDPNAEGSSIVNISIPLKMLDGSTQSLEGFDIDLIDGVYVYDQNTLSNAVLNTYINLAERFRNYFEIFRNRLLSIDNETEETSSITIPTIPQGSVTILDYITATSGSYGGTETTIETMYVPTSVPDVPDWSGDGPIYYNLETYPELLTINDSIGGTSYKLETITYEAYPWLTHEGGRRLSGGNFNLSTGASYSLATGPNSPLIGGPGGVEAYIEIPNFSASLRQVHITATAISSRTIINPGVSLYLCTEYVSIILTSGIGLWGRPLTADVRTTGTEDPNNYYNQFVTPSGEFNLSVSLSEYIDIPPNQSLFFTIRGHANTNLDISAISSVNFTGSVTVGIDGGNISVPDVSANTSYSGP